jgi:hypothetical protein
VRVGQAQVSGVLENSDQLMMEMRYAVMTKRALLHDFVFSAKMLVGSHDLRRQSYYAGKGRNPNAIRG